MLCAVVSTYALVVPASEAAGLRASVSLSTTAAYIPGVATEADESGPATRATRDAEGRDATSRSLILVSMLRAAARCSLKKPSRE